MGEVLDESDGIALNSAKVVQVRFLPVLECSWGEFAHTKPPGVPSCGPKNREKCNARRSFGLKSLEVK